MHAGLYQRQERSILEDTKLIKKIEFNKKNNEEQDHTQLIDSAAANFNYALCKEQYWQEEKYSLLYGTALWGQASNYQRLILNHLYWVAYYSQIISAEIATIYLNQVAAAGLYTLEDFRIVCDSLDLESKQERAHINAFKTIGETVEFELFGERLFTFPMRNLFCQTMVFSNENYISNTIRNLGIRAYAAIAASNPFLGSQYLLIRGIRTLNGKLIQHKLAQKYMKASKQDKDNMPIPTKMHYYHFMDESYHFNTSKIISKEVPRNLDKPSKFEKFVVNFAVNGCQQDHYYFSAIINGIFWYDPAAYTIIYKLFRSNIFNMEHDEALDMLTQCFCYESDGLLISKNLHQVAIESYKAYVDNIDYLYNYNKNMSLMSKNSIDKYLKINQNQIRKYKKNANFYRTISRDNVSRCRTS